jgi:hypothetical protein
MRSATNGSCACRLRGASSGFPTTHDASPKIGLRDHPPDAAGLPSRRDRARARSYRPNLVRGQRPSEVDHRTDAIAAPHCHKDEMNKNARRMPEISGRGSDQTVTAVCPHLPTIRGTPGTIAASLWLSEPQRCRRGISPGIRRTWLVAAVPAPPESAAIPAIPC